MGRTGLARLGLISLGLALLLGGLVPSAVVAEGTAPAAVGRTATVPALHVSTLVHDLSVPWDVKPLPGGRLLIDERTERRLIVWKDKHQTILQFPSAKVWASGETGLMGLAVDPSFARNRLIYTCQGGFKKSGRHDVRVVQWRMNSSYTGVSQVRVLVSGFPTSSGRHGGCRLLIPRNGSLMVGTGDAAIGTNPQSLRSFGGKVLRLNRNTGAPWAKNPWPRARSIVRRYVYNYGHRNVQGLVQRSDGSIWSVEQGTYRDDEVNKLVAAGNYGYNPVPGYNESVPMTDYKLPGRQIGARWSSGDPTLATSGGVWISGKRWGAYNGTLAVAALKANEVVFLKFNKAGTLLWTRTPSALRSSGRLRSLTMAPGGDLLVTTSNDDGSTHGSDKVLRVHPILG
ncbi:MAG TPA: PQQ-dependent sugar dehydrogenase [Marmoricola sp.]|nr:PQQ-dependent sugar dehydrogenase [Marmoricola sp.]